MSRSVQIGLTLGCLSLVAAALAVAQFGSPEIMGPIGIGAKNGSEVQLAARYHLRSRTPDFYSRAKAGASPRTRAK